MAGSRYRHSAYWYAYHNGWTHSEAESYAGRYLDMHTYRPWAREMPYGVLHACRPWAREMPDGEFSGREWLRWRNAGRELDSSFNPLLLCAFAMVDVGNALRDGVAKLADPAERDRMRRELMRDLRRLRRPFYYARETERRRALAAARRRVARRTTTAPMPTLSPVKSTTSLK